MAREALDVAEVDPQQVANDLADARRQPKLAPHELTIRRKDGKPYAESSLRWGRDSHGKTVLDGLLHDGVLALAGRRNGNERLYDLAPAERTPERAAIAIGAKIARKIR